MYRSVLVIQHFELACQEEDMSIQLCNLLITYVDRLRVLNMHMLRPPKSIGIALQLANAGVPSRMSSSII